MDPLSDVLALVRPRSYGSGGLTAGGLWALDFPAHEGIKCYVLVKGQCWAVLDGVTEPVRMESGDCLMLPHGRAFKLCSDLGARAIDARTLAIGARYNTNHVGTPDEDFFLLGGHFALEGNAELLLGVLPPFVHLRKEAESTALRGCVERMREELRDPQPGSSLIAEQTASTMLVLVLRRYLATARHGVGWLFALADGQLAGAVASMHGRPFEAWTVQTLAETVGMSRTTFAQRFRETVGESPMEYLTRWRMLLAGDRLVRSTDSISVIAQAVGYESESAFSAAFKRTMGASPRAYAREKSRRAAG